MLQNHQIFRKNWPSIFTRVFRRFVTNYAPEKRLQQRFAPIYHFTQFRHKSRLEPNKNDEKSEEVEGEKKSIKTTLKKWFYSFKSGLIEASYDLVGSNPKKNSTIVRKLRPLEKDEKDGEVERRVGVVMAPEATGAMAIVKTANEVWEVLNQRLKESQLIQDLLAGGSAVSKTTGMDKVAKKAKEKIGDKIEQASEVWETSQHPMVYKASSVWDRITAETDAATAQRLLRKLDPYFDLEEWKEDLSKHVIPDLIGGWLRGDENAMRNWLSGDVLKKYLAEIEARRLADRIMDPHLLDVRHVEVILYRLDGEYASNPALIVRFMIQHINCIKNSKNEIIEGTDSHASAKYFLISMHRIYDEHKNELRWKVGDLQDVGFSMPFY